MNTLKFRFRIFTVVFLATMLVGTLGFMGLEGLSPMDAFYFSIVTIATVGYGDIHPATPQGKLLAIILIVCGVGTFLGVVANATEMFMNRREEEIRKQKLHMVTGLFFSEIGTGPARTLLGLRPQARYGEKRSQGDEHVVGQRIFRSEHSIAEIPL